MPSSIPEIDIDPLDRPVWGDKGFAAVLKITPKRAEHLRRAGLLDVDPFGGRYVSTPRRLLQQFAGKSSTLEKPLPAASSTEAPR
jgi:hypothetical protein